MTITALSECFCAHILCVLQRCGYYGEALASGSLSLQVGFGIAVESALELGLDWIWDRIRTLSGSLRSKLQHLPGVQIHDAGKTLSGLVTFTVVRSAPRSLLMLCIAILDRAGVRDEGQKQ